MQTLFLGIRYGGTNVDDRSKLNVFIVCCHVLLFRHNINKSDRGKIRLLPPLQISSRPIRLSSQVSSVAILFPVSS